MRLSRHSLVPGVGEGCVGGRLPLECGLGSIATGQHEQGAHRVDKEPQYLDAQRMPKPLRPRFVDQPFGLADPPAERSDRFLEKGFLGDEPVESFAEGPEQDVLVPR